MGALLSASSSPEEEEEEEEESPPEEPLVPLCEATLDFLARHDVDPVRGFLPRDDPLEKLPQPELQPWESLISNLPDLLRLHTARQEIRSLPVLSVEGLTEESHRRRALLLLSMLAHAYVWEVPNQPADTIPQSVAAPLCSLCKVLGSPPILTHQSIVLYNWKRQDPSGPIVTSNMKALCHFLGGPDESWFYLQTVEIEAWGGPAMAALVEAQETVLLARNAAADGGAGMEVCLQHLALCLWKVADSVRSMRSALGRMYHGCRPREFYHVVRPFLSGWRGNPSLPGGVAYGECPDKREYCGGSAAQSSLFSALDAVLGIRHDASSCNNFLVEILDYMPPKHKAFILDLADESRPKIRMFIAGLMGSSADSARETLAAYDDAVAAMEEFRTAHISIVATYVIQQTPRDDSRANAPGDGKGTGGTPLLNFLRPLRDDSRIPLGGVP